MVLTLNKQLWSCMVYFTINMSILRKLHLALECKFALIQNKHKYIFSHLLYIIVLCCSAKYLFLLLSDLHRFHGFRIDTFIEWLFDVSPDHQTNPNHKQHTGCSQQHSWEKKIKSVQLLHVTHGDTELILWVYLSKKFSVDAGIYVKSYQWRRHSDWVIQHHSFCQGFQTAPRSQRGR